MPHPLSDSLLGVIHIHRHNSRIWLKPTCLALQRLRLASCSCDKHQHHASEDMHQNCISDAYASCKTAQSHAVLTTAWQFVRWWYCVHPWGAAPCCQLPAVRAGGCLRAAPWLSGACAAPAVTPHGALTGVRRAIHTKDSRRQCCGAQQAAGPRCTGSQA